MPPFQPLWRRLPTFEPLSYRLHTTAALPLSDDEYLTFTPSVTYTPQAVSSSLLLGYHAQLTPSLHSSLALDLASPASLTASTSVLLSTSAVTAAVRCESDGVSVKAGWKRQLGNNGGVLATELAAVGSQQQSVWLGYANERRDGRAGQRLGVTVRSNGAVEATGRVVRPLQWCPPFNRCYLQVTSLHHTNTPSSLHSHDASAPPDPLVPPSLLAQSATFSSQLLSPQALSFALPTQLSVEAGVGAHLNPQHSLDVGVGWSTLGCYVNVALSSSQSTFSFPVYVTAPASVSAASLPSLFTIAVGAPVAFCLLYSLVASPLYCHYTKRRDVLKAADSADSVAHAQLQGIVERVAMQQPAQYSQPQLPSVTVLSSPPPLTILTAVYGWRRGSGGEVHGLDVSGVLRFWVRGGRLRLSDRPKRRMLGFGVVARQAQMEGDEWRLGVLIVYMVGGVLREVWVGEREAAGLPSDNHRNVRVDGT